MRTPYDMPYDDTVCACGATLPEAATPGGWQDHGFCHAGCATTSAAGGYHLLDSAALEMAERASHRGGPGFERAIVRDWLQQAIKNGTGAMLARISAEADTVGGSPESWCWRLWSGGVCRAMRLTRKE